MTIEQKQQQIVDRLVRGSGGLLKNPIKFSLGEGDTGIFNIDCVKCNQPLKIRLDPNGVVPMESQADEQYQKHVNDLH